MPFTRDNLKDAIQELTECTDFQVNQVMDRIDRYIVSSEKAIDDFEETDEESDDDEIEPVKK